MDKCVVPFVFVLLGAATASVFAQTAIQAAAQTAAEAARTEVSVEPSEPFFKRSREGWFWYVDPPVPPAPPVAAPPPKSAVTERALTAQERDLVAFKAFQVKFERAMHAATQNPSEANVAHFLEVYADARRKASVFSDTAQAVAVRMPWIDETFTGGRPTSPNAMRAFDSIQMQEKDQLMRELSRTHGLYFFFRANCAYCHVQAPMLKQFEQKYGFTVFAVSMDGSSLPQFPNAMQDNGLVARISESMGVPRQHFVTPAVVLAQPSVGTVVPVGFGAMNMDEMVDRISTVVRVRDKSAGQASQTQIAALIGESPARNIGSGSPSAQGGKGPLAHWAPTAPMAPTALTSGPASR